MDPTDRPLKRKYDVALSEPSFGLPGLGRTNGMHSDDEICQISESLVNAEEHANQLCAEFEELERRKREIKNEEDKVLSRIKRYKVALASHKKLPEDVLRYIFSFCVGGISILREKRWLPSSRPPPAQLAISHVCSEWRRIVLEIPNLWTDIRINSLYKFSTSAAKLLLSRAKRKPVHLTIRLHSSQIIREGPGQLSFLSSYQIHSLEFYLNTSQAKLIKGIPAEALKNLEALTFHCDHVETAPEVVHVPSLTSTQCPVLRSLCIKVPGPLLQDEHFIWPWDQLHHLEITLMNITTCWNILSLCNKSLQSCTILTCLDTHLPPLPPNDIVLPHLQTLVLIAVASAPSEKTSFPHLIKPLVLPQLVKFKVSPGRDARSPQWSTPAFKALVQRSEIEDLKTLCIDFDCKDAIDVRQVFEIVPSLQSVTFPENIVFDAQVRKDIASGHIGRNLEYICLPGDSVADDMFDMVEERQETAAKCSQEAAAGSVESDQLVRPFKTVIFCASVGQTESHCKRQNALWAQGLDIQMHFYNINRKKK
ncbi:hypothetical protein AX17_003223 [Amanita inopinata Kibby_2008]|nr:hypothetical protein AX17_003223 [Amanita inopinata Kibby_2008]